MKAFAVIRRVRTLIAVAITAILAAVPWLSPAAPGPTDSIVRFYDDIQPLLAVHCHKCHAGDSPKGGLLLDRLSAALAGGKSGTPAVVPGQSDRSELIRRITSDDPDEQMPPKGPRLSAESIARIRQWIDAGARWPDRDDYWAFQPPGDPPVPAVANPRAWRNTIDRFLTARLEHAGIRPQPAADARTLLRRAYADLIGVPPSPEEAKQFLRDRSEDAFERLVDRLLDDPRYGERWARHWLDLARYGESDGYEDDKIRPHAWRYRDYVIRSLNADKPYDRFLQEQVAGDELWPEDPDAWIATGFARLGPWDAMSKEPERQRQEFLNDATDAVGSVFLGMTLGCARCHDHKYDRMTQTDYFRLQAFFAGVRRDSHGLKGDFDEPTGVTTTFRHSSAELKRVRQERDELMRVAREALKQEQATTAVTTNANAKEKKISEADVMKKVESRHPRRLGDLNAQIKTLERQVRLHEPVAEVVSRGSGQPPKTHVLLGGELTRPGPEVTPGFIEAMMPSETSAVLTNQSSGRADLARWLASPENPLTARVMVNRIWQHHFGAGLVATPSDFGRNGRRPTNPELLDWLAREFVRQGYSLKKMHRLILTSAAYRRSSASDPSAYAHDPENHLLWRMNRRRLESEALRDSILAIGGGLNPATGGPGVYAKLPPGVNVEFPNNDKELSWGISTPDEDGRRSVYLFQRRSLTYPLMEVFDAAPMNQSCAVRPQTTVAPQALALFNGEFSRAAARQFAERLPREAGANPDAQIDRAFELAFARAPSRQEREASLNFLVEQAALHRTVKDPVTAALVDFCHVLLNSNELLYMD